MSTTFFYVEDSESEGLLIKAVPIIKAVPEEAEQESLRQLPQSVEAKKEPLLHIPNELRDRNELLDLVLKDGIYNFTICMQGENRLSRCFTAFPDKKILSDWLIRLSKQRDQKHIKESEPFIKVFLVAIDKFNDEKIAPDKKPEEHKEHPKILPVSGPWVAKTSKLSSGDMRYSDKTDDPQFRWAYCEWYCDLTRLLEEGGGKKIEIDFGEMPLACKCEGIPQALHNQVKNIVDYTNSGGREPAVEF
ncbi:hypothetical protein FANTH_936 [Fusarium anthophilum]|uniref:Uncharacterized protein n=1 Tax=Fusarium anthophilum TaxID=48485 RepID=A0A8H5EBX4_9HYPO|nr:hypothetical protein FANTH_936 [Fusarium anthophilum]